MEYVSKKRVYILGAQSHPGSGPLNSMSQLESGMSLCEMESFTHCQTREATIFFASALLGSTNPNSP
jgi:hypothetical protein